jgi:hypothetical protein
MVLVLVQHLKFVYLQNTITNPRKLKGMEFWWSQWLNINVKLGHIVKQS